MRSDEALQIIHEITVYRSDSEDRLSNTQNFDFVSRTFNSPRLKIRLLTCRPLGREGVKKVVI